MRIHNPFPLTLVLLLLLILISSGCSAQATATPVSGGAASTTNASFTDPFAYCAAVGTIDAPDARYTGAIVPDAVIDGFKKAAGLKSSAEPVDQLRQSTIWRCMSGKVYACNFGANLPCDSKAETTKTPTQAMIDYCKANANSDFIPMSVTGHATVYSWHCFNDQPGVLEQIAKVDAEGYPASIWYPVAK